MVSIFPRLSGPLMSSARKQNIIPKPLMTVCVCSKKRHSSKCHILEIFQSLEIKCSTLRIVRVTKMFYLLIWNTLIHVF